MGEFLTDAEAAQVLCMPLDALPEEVHKCPNGYHEDVLAAWCEQHGIPVGEAYNAIAVGGPKDDTKIVWTDSEEEALIRMNSRTRVLFLSKPNRRIWNLLKQTGTRIVLVSEEESDLCHLQFPDWEEAKLAQEMYFNESRGE